MKNKTEAVKKERRFKFNAVDAVIIIVVLACVAGIYLRYNISGMLTLGNKLVDAEISFMTRDIRYTSLDYFHEGDVVYTQSGYKKIGVFEGGFTVMPAEYFHRSNKDGRIVKSYYPENTRIDVRGVIRVRGTFTENGFFLDGKTFLAPNSDLAIQTRYISIGITVTGISEATDAGGVE